MDPMGIHQAMVTVNCSQDAATKEQSPTTACEALDPTPLDVVSSFGFQKNYNDIVSTNV